MTDKISFWIFSIQSPPWIKLFKAFDYLAGGAVRIFIAPLQ